MSNDIEKLQETKGEEEKSEEAMQSIEPLHEAFISEAEDGIKEDLLQAPESLAQADVRELLGNGDAPAVEVEIEENTLSTGILSPKEDRLVLAEAVDIAPHQAHENAKTLGETESIETKMDSPKSEVLNGANTPIPEVTAGYTANSEDANRPAAVLEIKTPTSQAGKAGSFATPRMGIETLQEMNSPQIGTTILRRESLRSRGSPRKKSSAQKSKSPHRRHGLKKRDTLQEREILQQFIAAASPNKATETKKLAHPAGNGFSRNLSPDQSVVAKEDIQQIAIPSVSCKEESPPKELADTQTGDVVLDKVILDTRDLGRAVEAIEACQKSDEDQRNTGLNDASLSSEAKDNINQANNIIAKSEVQQAAETIAEVCEKLDLSTRKTRSGARISDDTSMLKDFLNRAQAKKAAKCVPPLSAEVPKLQGSPTRRSPRKALEPHIGEAVSPHKSKKSTKGPSTPPRKAIVEDVDSSDDQETVTGPTSFRRSTRTRLPAPSKTPPGAPSFIPVRRGDGSDQVILQKSQAQEMAIVTRANTRRNKGQSKPPALALQDLPPESPVKMTAKEQADHAKTVAWAEKLASYQESKDAPEEPEDQRPKVRRLRGLGAVNGTPAKKSTATVPSSNGTPAPKRRSKTK